jgi:hypothetical protein
MKICPKCKTELPDVARFCFHCGEPQRVSSRSAPPEEPAWRDDPVTYFVEAFMKTLRQRVAEEQGEEHHPLYNERLYQSGFRDTLQRRAEQFGQRAAGITDGRKVRRQVAELVDYFQVRHCADLNQTPWSEAVLKYQGFSLAEIDLFQMALDYLDFAHESETVYTDFLQMPMEKLRTAGQYFLFPEKKERILLICDQSIMGTCREGFALTEKALYWKAHLANPAKVFFSDLREINPEKDWIKINGQFFNANPSLNIKMMRLLRAIQRLQ